MPFHQSPATVMWTNVSRTLRGHAHIRIQASNRFYTANPSGTPRADRVRVIAFVKRKDDISREAFSRYWREEYAQHFTAIPIVKKNLLKYEQGHTNTAASKIMEELQLQPAIHWDGVSVLEAESYAKILEIFEDEECLKVGSQSYIDGPKCQLLPLDLSTFFDRDSK